MDGPESVVHASCGFNVLVRGPKALAGSLRQERESLSERIPEVFVVPREISDVKRKRGLPPS